MPSGWQDRLILVPGSNARHVRGWCLEVHDLAVAKLVAGREKDLEFVRALARLGYVERRVMLERLQATELAAVIRKAVEARIRAITDLKSVWP